MNAQVCAAKKSAAKPVAKARVAKQPAIKKVAAKKLSAKKAVVKEAQPPAAMKTTKSNPPAETVKQTPAAAEPNASGAPAVSRSWFRR